MKKGRSEEALAYVNKNAGAEEYNEFGYIWIRMLARVFRMRIKQYR